VRIAIVDDDPGQLERLSRMLSEKLEALGDTGFRIRTFPSGEAFLEDWTAGMYDVILLDIFMDKLLGIDVAHRIRQQDREVRLVFCTSSNEFASESYEVNACYYMTKPFSEKSVAAMLSRLDMESLERISTITLPDGQRVVERNILYTDYSNHVITIHCKNGSNIRCRCKQSELEELLCAKPFFCSCCKGMIVNFHEVRAIGSDTLTLTDGQTVPISRRRAKEVQDAYAWFLLEKSRRQMRG